MPDTPPPTGLPRRELLGALGATALGATALATTLSGAAWPARAAAPDWTLSEAEALAWHRVKDANVPALPGSPRWHKVMQYLQAKFAEYGCVGLTRSAWTFPRFDTSIWPDASGWRLTVAGAPVRLANVAANCGTTGPEGVTAKLLLWDPAQTTDVAGRIVVYRPQPRADVRRAFSDSDYEYAGAFDSWPEEGQPVPQAQDGTNSISSAVWDDMTASARFIEEMRARRPAGVVFAMNLNRAATEGLYTFPVPADFDFPAVYVDRQPGDQLLAAAKRGASATLRVQGQRIDSEVYQLVGWLPGRDFGTAADEQVQLRTHTDGPSISQDNGAFGLLGVVREISRMPQSQRPRTLMIELDCRHFMPGMERAWQAQDYFAKFPSARAPVVAQIAMEHLGQIEYVADGDAIKPSGRSLPTWVYATGNRQMIDAAVRAATAADVRSVVVRSPGRPGIHGRPQGPWYGMSRSGAELGLPTFGVQGDLGAYWAFSGRLDRFDARSFCRQVAMFCQLTGFLMTAELTSLQPEAAAAAAPGVSWR